MHSKAAILALLTFASGPGIGAQEDRKAPEIIVTARAVFSRIAPADDGMEFRFNYKYPTAYLKDPPKTYLCSYDAMTYLVTTPDGKQHSLNLIDKKKDTGHFTSAYFNLDTYKIFDSIGAWPGLFNGKEVERRFYWKQTGLPTFTVPGEYRVIETGTFHDTEGELPDLSFRSTEAVCVVDPRIAAKKDLKAKAQEILRTRIGSQAPSKEWTIRESKSGDRIVSGSLGPDIVPEDQVPAADRKKGRYSGMRYIFTFTPAGQLISEETRPIYWIID